MQISPAQLGFIRSLAYVVIAAVLSYLGNAANLNGVVSDGTALLIAALAGSLDHFLESRGSGALFGAIKK